MRALAGDEVEGQYEVIVEEAPDTREAILRHASDTDLVVMGIRQRRGSSRGLGTRVLEVARASDVPLIVLGSRSGRPIRPERRPLP